MQYATGGFGNKDSVMVKGRKPFDTRFSFLNYKVSH